MINVKTFNTRKNEAKAAANFSAVGQVDRKGRASVVFVPGHEGKMYRVILKRVGRVMVVECGVQTSSGVIDCKGNSKTICYHSFAAINKAANNAGKNASICVTKEDAERVSHLRGGTVVPVLNKKGTAEVWTVVA